MHTIDLGSAVNRVHFIGIGGISMSGLAEILLRDGYKVTGSDDVASPITDHLRTLGVAVAIGNTAENITDDIDLVVYTAAVKEDNPEYQAARAKSSDGLQKNNNGSQSDIKRLAIMDRARLLGFIMRGYPQAICVAGTHGKTTTTSVVAEMCLTAGLDPTISIGGYMGEGYNFRVGHSDYFVMEACEYFDSFLQWRPQVGVILNIDNDHMDYFGSMERLTESFRQFAQNIAPDGALVIYNSTPGLADIIKDLSCRVITYDYENARFTARGIHYNPEGRIVFEVWDDSQFVTEVTLKLHGRHNVLNALAAAAVGHVLGIPAETIGRGVSGARGTRRRYEYKGLFNGAEVVDDYAHHPTEITLNLAAARTARENRAGKGRIICVFQPHTYSRTQNLLSELAHSFKDADMVVLLPIFASREAFDTSGTPGGSVSSRLLAEKIAETGSHVLYADSFDEAEQILRGQVIPGDLLITMGAGDVYLIGERLLRTGLSTLSTGV